MNLRNLFFLISLYDKRTYMHVYRVAYYSYIIGKQIKLSDEEMKLLLYSSLLHDIGKIFINEKLLYKKENLTDQEFSLIKKHVNFGVILLPVEMKEIKRIIVSHHERLDGSGYPNHLKENEIPKLSKIIAIADSFDAMTSNRNYNNIKNFSEAFADLFSNTKNNGKNLYQYSYVNALYKNKYQL